MLTVNEAINLILENTPNKTELSQKNYLETKVLFLQKNYC